MNYGIDIGGCISAYPEIFREMIAAFKRKGIVYIITDQHDKEQVVKTLEQNKIDVDPLFVCCADYKKYGNLCKAVLCKELGIDIFIDDFPGYLQWDSLLGIAPLRMLVVPDGFRPYYADTWKTYESEPEFGRRVAPRNLA